MNFVSKCLTAFVLIASVSFLGFAAVVAFGGRNWSTETRGLEEYSFTNSGGDHPTWKAEQVHGKKSVKESPYLPEVVVAALADKVSQQQTELGTIEGNIPKLKQAVEEAKSLIDTDLAALQTRERELAAALMKLQQDTEVIVNKGRAQTQEVQKQRIVGEIRREEVFRLQRQIEEIRADRYRAEAQKKRLENALVQMDGDVERLQERNAQLKQQLN